MRITSYIIFILILLAAGCLGTKEALPAVVDKQVLAEYGWTNAGEVQKQSQRLTGTEVNMAIMKYRDDRLARDITGQARNLSGLTPKQARAASQFTSQLFTLRLVLPAGIAFSPELVNGIEGSQLEEVATQNDIRNFHETGSIKTILINGKEVAVKNYEGAIDFEEGSIGVRGMAASWQDSDSIIIVIGVFPGENIVITPRESEPVYIKIDGEREAQEIIALFQNVH